MTSAVQLPIQRRFPVRRLVSGLGRVLSTGAVVLGVVAALVIIIPTVMGYDRYVIAGRSMTGSISVGDLVFAEAVPVSSLEVGDIITYMPPPETGVPNLVTHRIAKIEVDEQGVRTFQTKGDANESIDPWTFQLSGETQARYSFAVPYVGWALMGLGHRTFRMVLIGVPAAFIALMTIRDMVRDRRANKAAAASPVVAIASPADALA